MRQRLEVDEAADDLQDVGGDVPRTMTLQIGSGDVCLKVQGETKILWGTGG